MRNMHYHRGNGCCRICFFIHTQMPSTVVMCNTDPHNNLSLVGVSNRGWIWLGTILAFLLG